MGNPNFGKWSYDDAGGPSDGNYGSGDTPRDLRITDKIKRPTKVKIGNFEIENLFPPQQQRTISKIRNLAEIAVRDQGRKEYPFEYLLPRYFNNSRTKHLIPFFHYSIARILMHLAGGV